MIKNGSKNDFQKEYKYLHEMYKLGKAKILYCKTNGHLWSEWNKMIDINQNQTWFRECLHCSEKESSLQKPKEYDGYVKNL